MVTPPALEAGELAGSNPANPTIIGIVSKGFKEQDCKSCIHRFESYLSLQIGDKMKKCSKCKEIKEEKDFYWKDKKHTKLNSVCKLCSNARMSELRKERYNKVAQYKSEHGCKVCGEKRHWVLDFHHRDEDEKEKNVSRMICKNFTWERIVEEMEKCDILCANCHRDHHYHNK